MGTAGYVRGFRSLALAALAVLLALGLSGCGTGVSAPTVARVVITPGAQLLTASGESRTLTAQAYDASGDPLDAPISWSSSDDGAVTVDEAGVVTSVAALGSALITASAQGVDSFPASIVIAQPVAGAVLLADDDVVSGPGPATTAGQLQVTVRDATALSPGTIVLPSGSAAVAGRVETLEPSSGGTLVTYTPLPPQQLFERLSLDGTWDLARATPVLGQGVQGGGRIVRTADGGYRGTFGATATVVPEASPTCGGSAGTDQILISELDTTFHNDLVYHEHIETQGGDVSSADFWVDGKVTQTVSGKLGVNASFHGDYSCSVTLFRIPIPIDGVAAAIAHPEIPLGVTVTGKGSVSLAHVTVAAQAGVGFSTKVGAHYDPSGGVSIYHDFQKIYQPPTFSHELQTPDEFRVTLDASASLDSGIGLNVLEVSDIDLLDANFGPDQHLELAGVPAQAHDSGYASSYDLKLTGTVSLGKDLQTLFDKLQIPSSVSAALSKTFDVPLAASPTGSVAVSTTSVAPGDRVHVTVTLDPGHTSYLGHYNVTRVLVYAFQGDGDPQKVATAELSASNQSTFETDWNTAGFPVGDYHLEAFVVDDLLSRAVELPLEVDQDSGIVVHLAGVCSQGAVRLMSACGGTASTTATTQYADGSDATATVTSSDIVLVPNDAIPDELDVTQATISIDYLRHDAASGCTESTHVASVVVSQDSYASDYVNGYVSWDPSGTPGYDPAGSYELGAGAQFIPVTITYDCPAGSYTLDDHLEALLFATPQYLGDTTAPWPIVDQADVIAGSATTTLTSNGDTTTVDSSWNLTVPGVTPPN